MSEVTCRGSFALGTACGKCSRCRREVESYNAMKAVRDKLNTPSSALTRIEELEAKLAKAVGTLHEIAGKKDFADDPWSIARTTLAELTGGKDE